MSDLPTPETVERLWRVADAAQDVVEAYDDVEMASFHWMVSALRKELADLNATYPETVDVTR